MDQSFPPFHISAVLARFCSLPYTANHQPSEIQTFHETLFNFSSIPLRVDNCYTFREAATLLARVACLYAFSTRNFHAVLFFIFVAGFRFINTATESTFRSQETNYINSRDRSVQEDAANNRKLPGAFKK